MDDKPHAISVLRERESPMPSVATVTAGGRTRARPPATKRPRLFVRQDSEALRVVLAELCIDFVEHLLCA